MRTTCSLSPLGGPAPGEGWGEGRAQPAFVLYLVVLLVIKQFETYR